MVGALANIIAVNVRGERGIIDLYDSEGAAFIVGVCLRRDNVDWGRERCLNVDDGNSCCFKRPLW